MGRLPTQRYFFETIGNANEDVIRAYVEDQLKAVVKKRASYNYNLLLR